MQRQKQWHLRLGVLWVVSVGCGGGISFEGALAEPQHRVCSEDGDCSNGYRCEGGICTPEPVESPKPVEPEPVEPAPECLQPEACPRGYVCVDTQCKRGCLANVDTCGEGYVCEGASEGVLGTCRLGCQLGEDKTCNNPHYICMPPPGAAPNNPLGICQLGCRMDTPNACGGKGYACVHNNTESALTSSGMCRPGCRKDSDCPGLSNQPGNQICIGYESATPDKLGTCQEKCRIIPDAVKTTLDTCAPGYACKGEKSQTEGVGTCELGWCRLGHDNTCPTGQVCEGYGGNTGEGAPGICREACNSGTCTGTSTCKDGNVCRTTCSGNNATGDNQCDSDKICTSNKVCQPGCRSNNAAKSCLEGQRCEDNKCLNTAPTPGG